MDRKARWLELEGPGVHQHQEPLMGMNTKTTNVRSASAMNLLIWGVTSVRLGVEITS